MRADILEHGIKLVVPLLNRIVYDGSGMSSLEEEDPVGGKGIPIYDHAGQKHM